MARFSSSARPRRVLRVPSAQRGDMRVPAVHETDDLPAFERRQDGLREAASRQSCRWYT